MNLRKSTSAVSFLVLIGAWLAIFTPGVLSLSLHIREFDSENFLYTYPITLVEGWLTLMVSLVLFGILRRRFTKRVGVSVVHYSVQSCSLNRRWQQNLVALAVITAVIVAALLSLAPLVIQRTNEEPRHKSG